MTPDSIDLHMALYGDDLHEVYELLLVGANANQVLPAGSAPLLEAQTYELAALLIEHGASVHCSDGLGRTVMHNLAYADHPERMGRLFYRLGANLEERDGDGRTPLLMVLAEAQALPKAPVVLLLLGADALACDAQGNNALHCWASGRARMEVGERLIALGVDPLERNRLGESVEDILVNHHHDGAGYELIRSLLQHEELVAATPSVSCSAVVRRL